MEKLVDEDKQPQAIVESCSCPCTASNPPTPPFKLTQLAPSQASFLHVQKHQKDDDLKYFSGFPPGYKFNPDDDDLIVYYLNKKIHNLPLPRNKIIDVKLYEYNPKDLAEKYEDYWSRVKEKKWYFFTPRDRKYKNGSRPNRAAGNGYWKATGADKKVKHDGKTVGYRKSLVFYVGKPPKGDKTNWIMHEFRVADPPKPRINGSHDMKLDEWVLCSIHEKDERPSKNKQPEDSVSTMDDDAENGNDNDNDNNLMVPYDDQTPIPDPYNQRLFSYPVPSPSSFNPFNFANNQLVEDVNNQLDYASFNFGNYGSYGGNHIIQNSPLRPLWKVNPTHATPLQSHGIVQDEIIYDGWFDELDPSPMMSIPVPAENPPVQSTRTVEDFHNSLVQPIRIAQNFDNSVAQPSIQTFESPAENPLAQSTRPVENFHNSLVQSIRIAQNFDNSVAQPSSQTSESPNKRFKSEK